MNLPGVGRVPRRLVTLLVALLVAGVWWWVQGEQEPTAAPESPSSSAGASPSATPTPSPSATPTPSPTDSPSDAPTDSPTGVDPESGLSWIDESDLPPEALDTLALIDEGGPYPYDQDDETFQNREGLLPGRPLGYYREYTVETPGSDDRGARRIVTGSAGEYYWTEDHYASFERIAR